MFRNLPALLPPFLLILTQLAGCGKAPSPESPKNNSPESIAPDEMATQTTNNNATFVKDESCRQCHERQFDLWIGSDHERAMDHATPNSVLGNFDNATFTQFDEHWRFFKEGDAFKVGYRVGEGEETVYPVEYTFGVRPLQQYLGPFEGGRYQCLPVTWDVEKKQWYHLYPDEPLRAGDPLHWTGRLQNWNYMCAECHSTDVQTGFDNATNAFSTTYSDINVGCQACHGPGSIHMAWANAPEQTRDAEFEDRGMSLSFKWNTAQYQVDQCARCHSRRAPAVAEDDPFSPYHDNFRLSTLQENLYFPDGQIQDEVYVYGSFVQSGMYHAGVRCTDCHDPHTTRVLIQGNDLCVRCHNNIPLVNFPTMKPGLYNDKSHHFHEPGTPGAACVNCHMADRVYMGIDARRDHSFRVPRPDLSVALGIPNACNQCHTDKDAQWASDAVKQWYGEGGRWNTPHFATTIAAGRAHEPEAEDRLATLSRDSKTAAIVRATALELLHDYPGATATEALLAGLKDESSLVRTQAAAGMDRLPPEARGEVLGPLLTDPMAPVRNEATRLLAGAPGLDGETEKALNRGLAAYTALQLSIADQPEAHLNLALIAIGNGDATAAEAAYRKAIERDPQFIPARVNLANLYNSQGKNSEAEHLLAEALGLAPNEGELHYSMGLLLAEMNRLDEAAVYMKRATELLPGRARVFYNYGLLLQHQERRGDAEDALQQAHKLDKRDGGILQGLIILFMQEERWVEAKSHAEQLLALDPQNPELQQWVAGIMGR
jgi:predicted CXXCH cytochrome family protein